MRYGTVLDLRRGNRSALMRALYFHPGASRQELGTATGLSAATVSNVVNDLMSDKLVIEAGAVSSDGGRPRTLVRVNPAYGYVIGVDIGETQIRVELFAVVLGTPLAGTATALDPANQDVDVVVADLVRCVNEVTAVAQVSPEDVIGIGIGVSGIVDVSLIAKLRSAGVEAPIFVDNGAANLGQAEHWFGASRGVGHAIVTLIGSGVGASVITDGCRYRGASNSAGEWGHTPISVGGRQCRCGARGCLEAYLGAEAILQRYHEGEPAEVIATGSPEGDLDRLLVLARTDRTAQRTVAETARYFGAGLATLINLFNPERIIIGGWAGTALGNELLPRIRTAAGEHALRQPFAQTEIELCTLGEHALTLGAATLPVDDLLVTTRRKSRDLQSR